MNKLLNFQVSGMHCQSCELLIREELSTVAGIKDISIDHKTGRGSVMLAGKQVKPGLILDAAKKAGYAAVIHDDYVSANDILLTTTDKTFPIPSFTLPPEIQLEGKISRDADGQFSVKGKLIFSASSANGEVSMTPAVSVVNDRANLVISGMHCSSCAGLIERQLKKVPGVSAANVNFAAEKARVIFDGSITTTEQLIAAVKKVGLALKIGLNYQGYNVTENNDPAAGQLIAHLHFHVIPRFEGDGLKLWPQRQYSAGELEATAEKLKKVL